MTDHNVLARYPFMDGAREILRENDVDVDRLLSDRLFTPSRKDAVERVLDSIRRSGGEDDTMSLHFDEIDERECILEISTYILSRMLVSYISDELLFNWYAHWEATTQHSFLSTENEEVILEIAQHFGIEPQLEDDEFRLHFTKYLHHTSRLKGPEWKLVNRGVEHGMVSLSQKVFARMLMETIRLHTLDRLKQMSGSMNEAVRTRIKKEFTTNLKRIANELATKKAEYGSGNFGEVTYQAFPPCMNLLIERMRKGDNLSHEARFAITSFLHTIGMSSEDILKFFGTSPDFDAERSRYQIEHISGSTSATEYTPPECKSMKTFGLCQEGNKLCEKKWMNHPLMFYRVSVKDLVAKGGGVKAADAKAGGAEARDVKAGGAEARGVKTADAKAADAKAGGAEAGGAKAGGAEARDGDHEPHTPS